MDLLKPEYNILKVAGNSYGYKHQEELKGKMSAFWKGNSNSKNQPHWRASAARLRLQKIEVTDLKLNTKTVYDSINAAAKALNIDAGIISKYFSLTK